MPEISLTDVSPMPPNSSCPLELGEGSERHVGNTIVDHCSRKKNTYGATKQAKNG